MNFNGIYNKCMSALTLSSIQLCSAGFIVLVQLQYASIFLKFNLILFYYSFCQWYIKKTQTNNFDGVALTI